MNHLGWQKAVLVFIGLSLCAGCMALCVGICTPCSPPCALIHSALCFISFFSAIVASGIFFFAAHRVDSRFVQGLQTIGEAFYCYLVGCILLMLVFILSIIGAYNAFRNNRDSVEYRNTRELTPLYYPRYGGKTTV